MKFRGHETFPIRKGWLVKGLFGIDQDQALFTSTSNNPTIELGIGINMVRSLRYWLQATGLTIETTNKEYGRQRIQELSELGHIIKKYDPFFEDIETLTLIHFNLARNKQLASTWYFFFNEFRNTEFNQDDFLSSLNEFINRESSKSVANSSLESDFTCLINTYYKNPDLDYNPEDNIICPLTELELITKVNSNKSGSYYRKKSIDVNKLNPYLVMYFIKKSIPNKKEITFNELLNNENSIGKIFNLDNSSLMNILRDLQNLNEIRIQRTAGLDIINILNNFSDQEYLEKYFKKKYQEFKTN